jgi:hypothetical protein
MSCEPIWLGRAILWLCAPKSERETIIGDLVEEFRELGANGQRPAARQFWFLRQAVAYAGPLLVLKWQRGKNRALDTGRHRGIFRAGDSGDGPEYCLLCVVGNAR